MFKLTCEATIRDVRVRKKRTGARWVRMRLERDLDATLADALGKDAKKALALLIDGALTKVVIPLDAVEATATLEAKALPIDNDDEQPQEAPAATVQVQALKGVRAIANTATKEDGSPTITIEFEMAFEDIVWSWLGRNCGGTATIDVRQKQLELRKAS